MSTRICIAQLVRPDGTVLTEGLSPEIYGPTFGAPDPRDPWGQIAGPVYGRWRYADENEWHVTRYWPSGPGSLPAFADSTGEGRFHSMNPADPAMAPDEVAQALTLTAAAPKGQDPEPS
jgi:hypothetical protein